MRLNKQRTAYLLVLGLGAAALVVDRVFLGTGATDAAATAAAREAAPAPALGDASGAPAPASAGPAAQAAPEGEGSASVAITHRLRAWKDRAGFGPVPAEDSFAVPTDWVAKAEESRAPAFDPKQIEAEATAKFRLLGTMGGGAKGFKVLLELTEAPAAGEPRERTLRVQDSWKDATVIAATAESATIEYRGVPVILKVERAGR